jgi:hypothetical protein
MADLDDIPSPAEFAQYRNQIFAIQHGGQPVWDIGQLNQAIGSTVSGRTWREIHEEMRVFLQNAPAGP